LDDWSFAGRSNGWFALLIRKGHFVDEAQQRSINRIEKIIKRYFDEYADELMNFYKSEGLKFSKIRQQMGDGDKLDLIGLIIEAKK